MLLLVDGSNIMFRSFFGVRPFVTKTGLHTNAVYGLITTLSARLEESRPDRVAVAFDLPEPTFRHRAFAEYKGKRQKMPPELAEQIPYVRRAASALGCRVVDLSGYEADDIIGTLSRVAEDAGEEVRILTGDRDSLQLITDKTKLLFITQKEIKLYGKEEFALDYSGAEPPRLVDIKALMGDASDNIPGVPGVGEKTAVRLIAEAGSLEALYSAPDSFPSVKGKLAEKLASGRDLAFMSYDLARIRCDAPVKETLDELSYDGPDRAALAALCAELEFHSLASRFGLTQTDVAAHADAEVTAHAEAAEILPLPDELPPPEDGAFDTAALVEGELAVLRGGRAYVGSVTSPGARRALSSPVVCHDYKSLLNSAFAEEIAANVEKCSPAATASSPTAENAISPAAHAENGKETASTLEKSSFPAESGSPSSSSAESASPISTNAENLPTATSPLPVCAFDTMLAAYVLHPGEAGASAYSLEHASLTYLSRVKSDAESASASERAAAEAALTSELADAERAELARLDAEAKAAGCFPVSDVLYKIELPLTPVLARMEAAGFHVDVPGILSYSEKLAAASEALAERIYAEAGRTFNLNSPKQLGEVLFVDLGLPAGKKNRRGYSTDAETLESLRYSYDIVDDILSYRQIAKLRSTYGETLAASASADGRIHTSFNQAVTATGRLSSAEPNLQNIPVRTELGRELRRFFTASDSEHVLVDADYSQIELRLLAAISGDRVMTESFLRGSDIHTATASEVFGVPESAVTRELRSRAKAVNFGIVYGIGDYSLSRDIGTTRRQAAEYIERYLATYRGVDAYLKGAVESARERGWVSTMFGRRRAVPEITAQNKVTRAFGERVAMNSPIQGTAADVIKLAMIKADRALASSGLDARLIMQVHDELIAECRREDADEVARLLRESMESVTLFDGTPFSVPLCVDVSTGETWFDCK